MNRVFGIILCVFSLVGLVSSPALAAMSCAMQHQKSQPAISANEVPVADLASNTDLKFKHCAEMAAAADSASQVDSDIAETSVMFTGMDCDCSTGCSLTAPAVISNVEVSLNQHPSGDIVMFSRYSVVESFRSRLYRPPIA